MPYGDAAQYNFRPEEGRFELQGKPQDTVMRCDSEEGLFAQYMALRWRDPSELEAVRSSFHSGPGQLACGANWRHRVDAALWYRDGEVVLAQYHGGRHYRGHKESCRRWMPGDEFYLLPHTELSDQHLRLYAEHLSRTCEETGVRLRFRVVVFTACDLFHGNRVRTWDGGDFAGVREALRDPAAAARAVAFPRPPAEWKPTEREMLEHLLEDEEAGGFVVLEGGEECRRDQASLASAFLFSKYPLLPKRETEGEPRAEQLLGPEAVAAAGGEPALTRACRDRELAGVRHSFGPGRINTLSVQMFRFLVEMRRLRGFRVLHYIRYNMRDFHAPFLVSVLEERTRLKATGGDSLSIKIFKLVINATYGYLLMEERRFAKSKTVTLETMKRSNFRVKGDVLACTLLGARAGGEKTKPDLVYGLTYRDLDGHIVNCCNVGSMILQTSKLVFLASLLFLATVMDLRKCQLVYQDTDSTYMWLAEETLEECVREDMRKVFREHRDKVLGDAECGLEEGGRLQTLRLKDEGSKAGGVFLSLKSYMLTSLEPDGDSVRRNRGIPKHVVERLGPEEYSGEGRQKLVSHWSLRPTAGLAMGLSVQGRKLPSRTNFKRFSVSRHQSYPLR